MSYKKNILNFSLIIISFLIGISIVEVFGRFIGLGDVILYDADHLVGYRLKSNQSAKRRKNSFVNSDYEGFRFDPNSKLSNSSEFIVFIGDSVTYGGSYIDNSDLFSSKYCQLTNEIDFCLNNGLNAWGTMNMGRFIANYDLYSSRKPRKLILVILPGDERRNLKSFTDTPFWSSKPRNPKAINEVFRYILLKIFIPFLQISEELSTDKELIKNKEIVFSTQRKQSWEELNLYLNKAKYPLDIVITPPRSWFEKKENNKEIQIYKNLLETLDSYKINKKCNLYEFVKNQYSPDLYVDNVHLSAKGHDLWAKKLKVCLKE